MASWPLLRAHHGLGGPGARMKYGKHQRREDPAPPLRKKARTMTPSRMNVESFNLDHRLVRAPYVRVADRKTLPHGDVITKYDVRFTQPNVGHLQMQAVHSLEHLFAEYSRNHSSAVIDFSPMGCQTGFYLILQGEPDLADVLGLIEESLTDILNATEVPAANEVQCGWGENHSLEAAQDAARGFLAQRPVWEQVFA